MNKLYNTFFIGFDCYDQIVCKLVKIFDTAILTTRLRNQIYTFDNSTLSPAQVVYAIIYR